jgi:hypothetical protein
MVAVAPPYGKSATSRDGRVPRPEPAVPRNPPEVGWKLLRVGNEWLDVETKSQVVRGSRSLVKGQARSAGGGWRLIGGNASGVGRARRGVGPGAPDVPVATRGVRGTRRCVAAVGRDVAGQRLPLLLLAISCSDTRGCCNHRSVATMSATGRKITVSITSSAQSGPKARVSIRRFGPFAGEDVIPVPGSGLQAAGAAGREAEVPEKARMLRRTSHEARAGLVVETPAPDNGSPGSSVEIS